MIDPISTLSKRMLIGLSALMFSSQAPQFSKIHVVAVDRKGDALSKVRIAMVPAKPDGIPIPRCVYPYCEGVSPGRYIFSVAADKMLTIRREISVSMYDRVIFAEMVPLFIVEDNLPLDRGIVVTIDTKGISTDGLTVRLIGVLNDVIRSGLAVNPVVEFSKVITGKYILLLLREGKPIDCRIIWHDDASISRETLMPGGSGCELRL